MMYPCPSKLRPKRLAEDTVKAAYLDGYAAGRDSVYEAMDYRASAPDIALAEQEIAGLRMLLKIHSWPPNEANGSHVLRRSPGMVAALKRIEKMLGGNGDGEQGGEIPR